MIKFFKQLLFNDKQDLTTPISADIWLKIYEKKLKIDSFKELTELSIRINKKIEDIKHLAEEFLKKDLINKNIHKRIEKIVNTSRTNYVKYLNQFMESILIADITDFSKNKELFGIFSNNFEEFSSITQKPYIVLKNNFYKSLLDIINNLNELKKLYVNFDEISNKKKIKEFDMLKKKISEYKEISIKDGRSNEDIKYHQNDIDAINQRLIELTKQKSSLMLHPDFQKYKEVYLTKRKFSLRINKKKEKIIKIFTFFSDELKSIKRDNVNERLINKYINDPINTLLGDVTGSFSNILKDIEKEVKNNKRKHSQIKNIISEDLLTHFIREYKNTSKLNYKNEAILSKTKLMNDIGELDYKIEHFEEKLRLLMLKLNEAKKKINELKKDNFKEKLEYDLLEFADRQIILE